MPVSIKKLSMKGGWPFSSYKKKPSKNSSKKSNSLENSSQGSKLRESSSQGSKLRESSSQESPNPNKGSRLRRATRRIGLLATKGIGKIRSKIRSLAGKLTKKFKPKNYKQELIDKLYENKIPFVVFIEEIDSVKSQADADELYNKAVNQNQCDSMKYVIDKSPDIDFNEKFDDYYKNEVPRMLDSTRSLFPPSLVKPSRVTHSQHHNNAYEPKNTSNLKQDPNWFKRSFFTSLHLSGIPYDYVVNDINIGNIQNLSDLLNAHTLAFDIFTAKYKEYTDEQGLPRNKESYDKFKNSVESKVVQPEEYGKYL